VSENLSAVTVIISASVARSGISQDAVSVAFGTTVLINEASIYFALSESSLSAILNLSAHTKVAFSVSIAGES
jgi:acetyl-CoA carboxylase alpha subunit